MDKELLELLKLVYSKIRNRTPKARMRERSLSGFCAYNGILYMEGIITIREFDKLGRYFMEQARKTSFEIRNHQNYTMKPESWLFTPEDWVSRRRWLKETIEKWGQ